MTARFDDIIVFALESEAPGLVARYSNVFIIGVGKVKSAINCMQLINSHRPKRIINLGTAGGITLKEGTHRVNCIVQHDVNLMDLDLPAGAVLDDEHSMIALPGDGVFCGTGDLFVTEPSKLRLKVDLVDMEAYSVARAAAHMNIECEIWKYISETADSDSPNAWNANASAGENDYMNILKSLDAELVIA
jgi:adenosylhomocysteine nucleosidase